MNAADCYVYSFLAHQSAYWLWGSHQENKMEAVSSEVAPHLIRHLQTGELEVCRLSCVLVDQICRVLQGRTAIIEANGVLVVTSKLMVAPMEAASALRVCHLSWQHWNIAFTSRHGINSLFIVSLISLSVFLQFWDTPKNLNDHCQKVSGQRMSKGFAYQSYGYKCSESQYAQYLRTWNGMCTAEATIYWQPSAKLTVLAVAR